MSQRLGVSGAGYLPELSESELGSPDFTLAAETVGADQLEPKQNALR